MNEDDMMKQFEEYLKNKNEKNNGDKDFNIIITGLKNSVAKVDEYITEHVIRDLTDFNKSANALEALSSMTLVKYMMTLIIGTFEEKINKGEDSDEI